MVKYIQVKAINTKQKRPRLLLPAIVILTIVLLALGYLAYAYTSKNTWPFKEETIGTTKSEDGINYNPPTKQEVENSQEAKDNNAQRSENGIKNGQQSNASSTSVSVGIAYASEDKSKGVIDIRAFTPDVIEGTGTCTATLTLNGVKVTGESKAFIDSSSSQCEPILIKRTDFTAAGKWSLVVSYDSPTSSGKSPVMEVEITNE